MDTTTVSNNVLKVYLNIFGKFLKNSDSIIVMLTARECNMQYIQVFIVFIYEHILNA